MTMHQITAKFMSHLQEENHVNKFQDLQARLERDPEFLSKLNTGGETWVCGYDPETKQQSFHISGTAHYLHTQRQVYTSVKSMLTNHSGCAA
jgi:hypothetical protein